ncbi:MAG TPA: sigma factor [Propionibacteriaceae bacterium]
MTAELHFSLSDPSARPATAAAHADSAHTGLLRTDPGSEGCPACDDGADAVGAARAGDVHAFDCVVRAWEPDLLRLAYGILGDHTEAEDFVQECFVTAWLSLPGLTSAAGFGAWIRQIASRQALQVLRRRARRLQPRR